MSVTSKTGLIPTQRKITKYIHRKKQRPSGFNLPTSNAVKPAEFSIRPFGGLYNPYAKGCSVLCNHPAPTAVRSIIRKVKDTWSSEGKTYWPDCVAHHQKDKYEGIHDDLSGGNIPEDLFRRYTDTDSRPLTPSPTTASVRTRTSAGSFLNARRCVTPEPGKDAMIKRKKIILDLRRSHSQETLCWRAPSEVSQGIAAEQSPSTLCRDGRTAKEQKADDHNAKKKVAEEAVAESKTPAICINEKELDDNGAMQRRGKRRKKSKSKPPPITFHMSQDPETQIATLGPDSLSASTRPSLVPNGSVKLLNANGDLDNRPAQLKDSFLTEEAFRVLKTELDIDLIENTFERYLNRALREAIKFVPKKKTKPFQRDEEFNQPPPLPFEQNRIPRKFSKSASRFEVPIDLASLQQLSVFEYLSRHVWISRQRKQLYKRIFLKYLKEDPQSIQEDNVVDGEVSQEETISMEPVKERTFSVVDFPRALKDALGFYGTKDVLDGIQSLLNFAGDEEINFRSWCGIVAFSERFALVNPTETDSCDELEKADFDTLEQRMDNLQLSVELRDVFKKIRQGHCVGWS